jgi:hemerythrin-like domain-containing protein
MMGSTRPVGLSSEARNAILEQHEQLRQLVIETSEAAALGPTTTRALDALRAKARTLYLSLDEHMRFEESVLEAALRDVVGRGAELHAQLEEEHQRQRTVLTAAMSELGRGDLPGAEIVDGVRRFVDALVREMDIEEQVLLSADVDALLVDGQAR